MDASVGCPMMDRILSSWSPSSLPASKQGKPIQHELLLFGWAQAGRPCVCLWNTPCTDKEGELLKRAAAPKQIALQRNHRLPHPPKRPAPPHPARPAWEQRLAGEQLKHDAAGGPHVHLGPILVGAQEQLGRAAWVGAGRGGGCKGSRGEVRRKLC